MKVLETAQARASSRRRGNEGGATDDDLHLSVSLAQTRSCLQNNLRTREGRRKVYWYNPGLLDIVNARRDAQNSLFAGGPVHEAVRSLAPNRRVITYEHAGSVK